MESTVEKIDLKASLKEFFGFDKFKDQQELIIQNVLDGNDTFVIMPTGGGKSLCYQLPALMSEGTAIVVSPLIALMKNQVDSVRSYHSDDEVAHFLNSSLNKTQERQVRMSVVTGRTKMLYVAPETLTKEENIAFLKGVDISFVAIDEAHCISEWGHDFRPEYRRIKQIINEINPDIPLMALTATATPKVQTDIVKTLGMRNEKIFISSFNRTNLFYEVRPKMSKDLTFKNMVQFIKTLEGQSGIIYVQSRKATSDIAKVLQVNGIKAAPYHAGLDSKTRSKTQDDFLMENIDVICATIAFGMGIDKPDVRFVIHYDMPKSIENYYQETGRAGRDGLKGRCIAYYSYKDLLRLEKFLRDKPAAERELGAQLLEEVTAYSETGACRRQFLLSYFGEEYNPAKCNEKCDNCKNPKPQVDVKDEMKLALEVIKDLSENYGVKLLVDFLMGKKTKELLDYRYDQRALYGAGKEKSEIFWNSLYRNGILSGYIHKSIEEYGVLKILDRGHAFMAEPLEMQIAINHDFTTQAANREPSGGSAVLDTVLLKMLKDIRRAVSKKKNVPPYIIFQDPSIEEMATQYPCTIKEMGNISGVSESKAKKYGKPFVELIAEYVEQNEIERPMDFVVKQVANKSRQKVDIIRAIDRQTPLEEIAEDNKLQMYDLLHEIYQIVSAGTKLNIDYYIEDNVDEYCAEDISEYFMEAESDSIDEAFNELKEDDITREEIELVRIKFLSDHAN